MGLSVSLSNALSGMATSQSSLNVLSRNVANAGTPGYHKQSLSVIDTMGVNSVFARSGGVERAFNSRLQAYYNSATSDSGYTSTMSNVLDQLQTYFGKPGSDGSIDTMFGQFQNALQALGTSPDDFATRATVVSKAQSLVATLNSLSGNIQSLRQATETQMQSSVNLLNQSLTTLAQLNQHLTDQNGDAASRSALMDQRDRLVSQISEQVDVQAQYRDDGTVALLTRTGVGLLDVKPATIQFQSAGSLSSDKTFSLDPSKSGVGVLSLVSSSGLTLDLVQQNVLQSGTLKALVDLRDKSLVAAQSQLDEVAAGLAQSMSTVTTDGTAATSGTRNGYSIDLASLRDGNDFTVTVARGGVPQTIKVVRVDDATKLPLSYTDANGVQVVGADFSSGATGVAATLTSALGPGFVVSGTGTTLTVLDGGSMGDDDRANYLLDQLTNMRFATPQSNVSELGSFRLGGSVGDLISQTMDFTGNVAADAQCSDETQQTAMTALNQRLDSEYGVNVDEEMARLLELQNAYSANARVISAVQDLMSKLLDL